MTLHAPSGSPVGERIWCRRDNVSVDGRGARGQRPIRRKTKRTGCRVEPGRDEDQVRLERARDGGNATGAAREREFVTLSETISARDQELMTLRGVGGKIADCVLLFGYGFDTAFPVDVWIERALQELYFPRHRASEKRLRHFAATHFGPHAGYAQQYLFHYMRTKRSN